ncbi:MAG: MFS transporter, partial [Oxalobacteraceae bacterium]
IANSLVRPLADKWFMSDEEVASLQAKTAAANAGPTGSFGIGKGGFSAQAALAWAVVGIPMIWGIWVTLRSSLVLFG